MKYLIFLAVFCLALIGCNAGGDEINYYTSDAQEMGWYESLSSLPTCDSSRLGKLAYVEDSSAVFFCKDSAWVRVTKAAETMVTRDSVFVDSISGCTFSKMDGLMAAICGEDTLWFEQVAVPHEVVLDSFVDGRDGQVYKTTSIGLQTWMAENLNYAGNTLDGESWCYDDDPSMCEQYGRLYNYYAAEDACPAGWRLPTEMEWVTLISTIASENKLSSWKDAIPYFISQTGWTDVVASGNYGLNMMPAGTKAYYDYFFYGMDEETNFWCAEETQVFMVKPYSLELASHSTEYGFSVRCVLKSADEVQVQSSSSSMEQLMSSSSVNFASEYDSLNNTLTDLRDSQEYKTTSIGTQVWMAENLNYAGNILKGKSWCYDNESSMCEQYGRLYDYYAAANACPAGWRLPAEDDWNTLVSTIIDENNLSDWDAAVPFVISDEGWTGVTAKGNYGLNILSAGNKQYYNSSFYGMGEETNFWCAEETQVFMVKPESLIIEAHIVSYGFSVRCIKD